VDAQASLGIFYSRGHGVPQDYAEAAKWHRKAAEQGDAGAQALLGFAYAFGQGVSQNWSEAYVWTNLAAANGGDEVLRFRDKVAKRLSPQNLKSAQMRARELANWIQARKLQ
jgi:TPR repeat protein